MNLVLTFMGNRNDMENKKILVADDEEAMFTEISYLLKDKDYSLQYAKDGHDAFNKIKEAQISENPFDLIITDIKMPHIDGLELVKNLNNEHIKTPVITMTAYPSTETLHDAVKKRCSSYLLKPINVEKLLDAINKATTN